MKIKNLFIVLAATMLFSACKKDSSKSEETDTNLLIGSWKITAAKAVISSYPGEHDVFNGPFSMFEDCQKDDIIKFEENGVLLNIDAGVKCVPPNDNSQNWTLNGNTLTIDGEVSTIKSLNSTNLIVERTETEDSETYTITLTLERQ